MTRPADSNPGFSDGLDRLLDLLCTRAIEGLSPAEEGELSKLLAQHPDVESTMFDSPAAAAYQEPRTGLNEPMPGFLRDRIEAASAPFFGADSVTFAGSSTSRRSFWTRSATLAWLGAAAAVTLAVFGWWPRLAPHPTASQLRASLLASDPTVRTIAWAQTADPESGGLGGDVVWSQSSKQGYMRFTGLAANDPKSRQYQLWIFDKNLENPEQPIDGGVFDIPPGASEIVVPITPKLPVTSPVAFAITIERPGGVVVSKREHLIALAK